LFEESMMPAKSRKSLAVVPTTAPPIEPPPQIEMRQIGPDFGVAAAVFVPLSLDSLADLGRDNFAAVTKANRALTEGLQAIGQQLFAYATNSLETASQTATALLGAKTLDEVIELNSALARSTLSTVAERSAKLSEMGMAVASEAFAPLGGRVEAAFHRLGRPAGA
jgi:hypothetical protein